VVAFDHLDLFDHLSMVGQSRPDFVYFVER